MVLAPPYVVGCTHGLGGFYFNGSGHGLHYIVRVVVDFKRWLFYLFHLHIQLVRELLQFAARVRGHDMVRSMALVCAREVERMLEVSSPTYHIGETFLA